MTGDLIERVDAAIAKSTSRYAGLLGECRIAIAALIKPPQDWRDITTLSFPHQRGSYSTIEGIVWLSNAATGEVKLGRPTRRSRDGAILLGDTSLVPTHWMPFTPPNPPATTTEKENERRREDRADA